VLYSSSLASTPRASLVRTNQTTSNALNKDVMWGTIIASAIIVSVVVGASLGYEQTKRTQNRN
jgi:anti-sigma-K factor RskA